MLTTLSLKNDDRTEQLIKCLKFESMSPCASSGQVEKVLCMQIYNDKNYFVTYNTRIDHVTSVNQIRKKECAAA